MKKIILFVLALVAVAVIALMFRSPKPPLKDSAGFQLDTVNWPLASGTLTFNIPVDWKIGDNGKTNSISGWNQVISIDGDGTVTVTKYGQTVTRTIWNIVTPSL